MQNPNSDEIFYPSCPWHIQVGSLYIAPGKVPNAGNVWIGEVAGGGREVSTKDLEPLLLKFYEQVKT